jgi:DNA-binding XRE family transcriptional regulator
MSVNKKEPTWAEYMRTVGINIQRERIKHDMSQERLAYSAGLSRFMYQQLEKG